jgi:hypothetical protein
MLTVKHTASKVVHVFVKGQKINNPAPDLMSDIGVFHLYSAGLLLIHMVKNSLLFQLLNPLTVDEMLKIYILTLLYAQTLLLVLSLSLYLPPGM